MERKVACGICGGELARSLVSVHSPDRFETHAGVSCQGYRRDWMECAECGSATSVAPEASKVALAQIAQNYYEIDLGQVGLAERHARIMALPPEKSDNVGRTQRVLSEVVAWWSKLARGQQSTFSVLDVGAGTGVFLARFIPLLRAAVSDVTAVAIEPDPQAAAFLRTLPDFEVFEGLFTGQSELRGNDLVTCNKVLEHVPDPLTLLRDMGSALNPWGLIYFEVPDVLTIGRRPPHDNALGALHHHLYSARGVAVLIERSGLVPVLISRLVEPSGKLTVLAFACRREAWDRLAEIAK